MASGQPRRRVPVQARAKERVERVLAAAEEVFAEVGFQTATTNQIARRAGTSIGSIYEFLGSKQGIAQALAERYVDEFAGLRDEALVDAGDDGTRAIDALVDLVAGFSLRHPGLAPLLAICEGSEDLRAARRKLGHGLIDPVEQLLARCPHSVDPQRRRLVAEMCVAILWTVTGEVAMHPEERRTLLLAELKLVLGSYVTTAFPRH